MTLDDVQTGATGDSLYTELPNQKKAFSALVNAVSNWIEDRLNRYVAARVHVDYVAPEQWRYDANRRVYVYEPLHQPVVCVINPVTVVSDATDDEPEAFTPIYRPHIATGQRSRESRHIECDALPQFVAIEYLAGWRRADQNSLETDWKAKYSSRITRMPDQIPASIQSFALEAILWHVAERRSGFVSTAKSLQVGGAEVVSTQLDSRWLTDNFHRISNYRLVAIA